jgi:Raf kinase inhibitor-like YbhB/YbcL family protein
VLRRLFPAAPIVVALVLATTACSSDGRTLAPIKPGQTTTTQATTLASTAPTVFTLSSDDVIDGGVLPDKFTCNGQGTSPNLRWAAAPAGQQLALVVRDRDAAGYVQWIVTGIGPTLTGFGPSAVPEGATEQVNSQGAIGYLAPCPPKGAGRHVYDFVLHALATPVSIDPTMPAADVAKAIETASTAQARLSVSVARA